MKIGTVISMRKNIKQLAIAAFTTTAVALSPALASSAQAAVLGGSGTCDKVSFTYLDCAGAFAGNDKGAQGTGLSNLNSLLGPGWSFAGDNESGLVSFTAGGTNTKVGKATTSLSGFGAFAVKAGNSYSLYTVANLASFDWSTAGVTPVGNKGNTPDLSHLSIYTKRQTPPPKDIPEPTMLLGLATVVGMGTRLKRRVG
jgi:hypothetical protein